MPRWLVAVLLGTWGLFAAATIFVLWYIVAVLFSSNPMLAIGLLLLYVFILFSLLGWTFYE